MKKQAVFNWAKGLLLAVATTGSLHAQNVTEPDVHDPRCHSRREL